MKAKLLLATSTKYCFLLIIVVSFFFGACTQKKETAEKIETPVILDNGEYNYPDLLHPLAKAYLRNAPRRNYDSVKIPAMRAGLKNFGASVFGVAQDGVSIKNDTVHTPEVDIPIRIYSPLDIDDDGLLPAIVYYHGGAWCFGGLDMVDYFGTSISKLVPVVVISVDYRLAPEHPFPAALDDCYSALVWVKESASSLGIDSDQIIVSGGSAGGNLATVVALKARDENGPDILGQLLIYPVTDLYNMNTYSYTHFGQNFGLQEELMIKTIDAYVPKKEERKNPYVSPLLASNLTQLPPAFVMTAGFDPLRDEGEAYANRLEQAGIRVKLSRYDSMIHGFTQFARIFPEQSNRAYEEMGTVITGWLND